jgi:hypothetical protein
LSFSPTLFSICLGNFLPRIEKPDLLQLGHGVKLEDGGEIKINEESHEDMGRLLSCVEAFCKYTKMKANGISMCQSLGFGTVHLNILSLI